ncbi:MAG: peptidase, partial [Chloroflexota bacterium]|nr:peptidase [Chloroflexota bacterium]
MVTVNSEILVWARETAALSLEEAAKQIFSDDKSYTAEQKLDLVENGKKELTRNQLNRMAKVYYQPILTFYLSEPPRQSDRGNDF